MNVRLKGGSPCNTIGVLLMVNFIVNIFQLTWMLPKVLNHCIPRMTSELATRGRKSLTNSIVCKESISPLHTSCLRTDCPIPIKTIPLVCGRQKAELWGIVPSKSDVIIFSVVTSPLWGYHLALFYTRLLESDKSFSWFHDFCNNIRFLSQEIIFQLFLYQLNYINSKG